MAEQMDLTSAIVGQPNNTNWKIVEIETGLPSNPPTGENTNEVFLVVRIKDMLMILVGIMKN